MKLFMQQVHPGDILAVSVIAGSMAKLLPGIAALLAVIYYGFVIYDRVKYGPELEARLLWRGRTPKEPVAVLKDLPIPKE